MDTLTQIPEARLPVASAAPARPRRVRDALVLLHRYTGLFLVVFVVVAAVTGTLLTFYHELDAALNPRLFRAEPPTPGAQPLDPFVLHERAAAQLPGVTLDRVTLHTEPGHTVQTWLPDDREAFIDPYDGRVLGTRQWGDLGEGWRLNLMPFLYRLHYSLALGEVGAWLFGIAALLWTLDCFVGAYLTFPAAPKRRGAGPGKSWLRRWLPAWLVKTRHLFSAIFTFHRAAGLWLWAMLFVFAWTGVGFNLQPVFTPVMGLFGYRDPWVEPPQLPQPLLAPALDWRAAHATGRRLMQAESERRGFTIKAEGSLRYDAGSGRYHYRVKSTRDVADRWPGTEVTFDAGTGQLLRFYAPTGEGAANTVATWLFALHMAAVGGLPFRLFVAVAGLLIAALAITGVCLWWRKRARPRTTTV